VTPTTLAPSLALLTNNLLEVVEVVEVTLTVKDNEVNRSERTSEVAGVVVVAEMTASIKATFQGEDVGQGVGCTIIKESATTVIEDRKTKVVPRNPTSTNMVGNILPLGIMLLLLLLLHLPSLNKVHLRRRSNSERTVGTIP
jgi:hypothetical protein